MSHKQKEAVRILTYLLCKLDIISCEDMIELDQAAHLRYKRNCL